MKGDSGGPMAVKSENGSFILAGIISWGYECGKRNVPGFYTRVSEVHQWIQETMSNYSNQNLFDFENSGDSEAYEDFVVNDYNEDHNMSMIDEDYGIYEDIEADKDFDPYEVYNDYEDHEISGYYGGFEEYENSGYPENFEKNEDSGDYEDIRNHEGSGKR